MYENAEKVELVVRNVPGTLGRVTGQIRREGWNIVKLSVEELVSAQRGDIISAPHGETISAQHEKDENNDISQMEMYIGGKHNKLAQVMERMLGLDCVLSVSMFRNGQKVTRVRSIKEKPVETEIEKTTPVPEKPSNAYRLLIINPGSTSTKFAVYDNENAVLTRTVHHNREELMKFNSIPEQKDYRKKVIFSALGKAGVSLSGIDAVAGRGGLLKPIDSGTYIINDAMLNELNGAAATVHASSLGAIVAGEVAAGLGIPAYVVDPIVVDEMDRFAKLTGFPGIERSSVFHALNQKAIARRTAEILGKPYENARFIVAHLGGGITIGAHRYGRVIDVNDALSGEGAFTPERSGGIPAAPLIKMCFSGEYTEAEMLDKIVKKGGMQAYLGTNDLMAVQKMINDGDEFAALVMDSMAYQVSKEIGAMTAVLEGLVDAIVLTGGLANSNRFTGAIKQRVDKLAPVYVFPGEDEMLALMKGVLRVLKGEEKPMIYE